MSLQKLDIPQVDTLSARRPGRESRRAHNLTGFTMRVNTEGRTNAVTCPTGRARPQLRWHPVRAALAALLVAAASLTTSCNAARPDHPLATPIVVPLPDTGTEAWSHRGRVLDSEAFDPPLDDPDSVIGESWRATYSSVSGVDGAARQVTGAFFVPRGQPPRGGWPIVSVAHGTTGIDPGCGPSGHPDLLGYLVEARDALSEGYAVALTDYEGLGPSGHHPYLEPRTAAFNVIDAVRALRELTPTVSHRWVAMGASQGGQATWAVNELNAFYGDGLDLLGTVAVSPAANVTGLADLAWSKSLSNEQATYLPLVIAGLERYNPGITVTPYLHGDIADSMGALTRCESPSDNLLSRIDSDRDLKPDTSADVDVLRAALQRDALPQRPFTAPMLVVYGDRDRMIPPQWVETAISESCRLGGRIEWMELADAGHAELTPDADRSVTSWISDRFHGAPAGTDCRS